jgi:hypothetical protein
MSPRQLHRLLVAPDTLVLDLADAALLALERAIRLEHPRLDVDPHDDAEVRRRARALLGPAGRLRRSLRSYRRAVERHIRAVQNDWPF